MTQLEKDILKLRAESIVHRAFILSMFQAQQDRQFTLECFKILTDGIQDAGLFSTMSDDLLGAVKREIAGFRPMVEAIEPRP
jgi:hypothetical protein